MSVEENLTLMRRWFKEVWNEGKMQTVRELLAHDAVGIGGVEGGIPVRGPAEFIPFTERHRGAFMFENPPATSKITAACEF